MNIDDAITEIERLIISTEGPDKVGVIHLLKSKRTREALAVSLNSMRALNGKKKIEGDSRTGMIWSADDDQKLASTELTESALRKLAQDLGRSPSAVRNRLQALGQSLPE